MRTRKAISSISYNSNLFLHNQLNELINLGQVSYWFFINHSAESNEKKDHTHLFIEPARQIQTDDLCRFLVEPVLFGDLPLKTMPFVSSVFSDWFFYCLHDPVYLQSKGLHREYVYSKEDFRASDPDILDYMIMGLNDLELSGMQKVQAAVSEGLSFRDMVHRGQVPLEQFQNYEAVFRYLSNDRSDRAVVDAIIKNKGNE